MTEFPLSADKLKKIVKLSREHQIAFGFNPGTDAGDAFLAAHRRKTPDLMGKLAKNEGAGTKSAFGTFRVDGNILSLTCERTVPNLANLFKRLLRADRINLNVQVFDEAGTLLEADVEEGLEDPFAEEPFTVGDEEDEGVSAASPSASVEPALPAGKTGIVSAAHRQEMPASPDVQKRVPTVDMAASRALAHRLARLQVGMDAAETAVRARLATASRTAVTQIRAGKLDRAERIVETIETILAALSRRGRAEAD